MSRRLKTFRQVHMVISKEIFSNNIIYLPIKQANFTLSSNYIRNLLTLSERPNAIFIPIPRTRPFTVSSANYRTPVSKIAVIPTSVNITPNCLVLKNFQSHADRSWRTSRSTQWCERHD